MSKGLGLEKVVASCIQIYCHSLSLTLLVNISSEQLNGLKSILPENQEDSIHRGLKSILPENQKDSICITDADALPSNARALLYQKGGLVLVTCRVLIVDLLSGLLNPSRVSCLFINNADKIKETSPDTFACRVLCQGNAQIKICAFSENIEGFMERMEGLLASGLERKVKALGVQEVMVYPRFHVDVSKDLSHGSKVNLVELRIPFTTRMKKIHSWLVTCIHQILVELKQSLVDVPSHMLTLENALSRPKEFYSRISLALEAGGTVRFSHSMALLNAIMSVRALINLHSSHDALALYTHLETVKQTIVKASKMQFVWCDVPGSDLLFDLSRQRVFKKDGAIKVEVSPKWKALAMILTEIKERIERERGAAVAHENVLIMCRGGRTAAQVRRIAEALLNEREGDPWQGVLREATQRFYEWRTGISKADFGIAQDARSDSGGSARVGSKRRRVKKSTLTRQPTLDEVVSRPAEGSLEGSAVPAADTVERDNQEKELEKEAPCGITVTVRSYHLPDSYMSDCYILDSLYPDTVILYDPDVSFVRRVEVFKASQPPSAKELSVYFMVYEDSFEEQLYLYSLRRENEAFEQVIQMKSKMALTIDQEASRGFGGTTGMYETWSSVQKSVVVDTREFRSALPMALHARGIKVNPCTLQVGDYVISPKICIERKSPSDLTQSLRSGRLFKQAQAMTQHYPRPILLVEFSNSESFSLRFGADEDTIKRLCLFAIQFPRFAMVWTPSPLATGEVIEDLQNGEDDPVVEEAIAKGSEIGGIDSTRNPTPVEILLSIPGIDYRNYQLVMKRVVNLENLSRMPCVEISGLIGQEKGMLVYNYFNEKCLIVGS